MEKLYMEMILKSGIFQDFPIVCPAGIPSVMFKNCVYSWSYSDIIATY